MPSPAALLALPLLALSLPAAGGAMTTHVPPRASPFAIRALRDMALLEDALCAFSATLKPTADYGLPPKPHRLSDASARLLSAAEGLTERVRAVETLVRTEEDGKGSPFVAAGKPQDLQALRKSATRLQQQVEEQRILIALIEGRGQESTTRAREIFDQIDVNGDGKLELEEFEGAARSLLTFQNEGGLGHALRTELRARFQQADTDENGSLSFDEFVVMLRQLQGNALGPLRTVFQEALEQLLDVMLQLTALSLTTELTSRSGRAQELSHCVDEWCELESRARIIESELQKAPEECDVEENSSVCASAEDLLREVARLAADISLTNEVQEASPLSMRRVSRQLAFALTNFKSSLTFCYRGLQLMCRDIGEVILLGPKLWKERKLTTEDVGLVKRTVADVVMLIPYAIVMIVPLTPPGHVFAFSLLNRCFPGAMPSAFTEKRQDIFEVYTRLAAQAQERSTLGVSLRGASWRKRLSSKIPKIARKMIPFARPRRRPKPMPAQT
ncbi:hypothetical protein AB1Y20_009891 [Prymnesium parvum]|uniref:EF-hand domain-containing protein n=1 Tax=Prymnesium parvum TaxID=97485 RepID=A0AB34K5J3_PRYPA